MSCENLIDIITRLRSTFSSRRTRPYEWRFDQLERLKTMVLENEEKIFFALKADLGKSSFESFMAETSICISEIEHAMTHLKQWMKPQKVTTPITNQPGHSEIIFEPLGVALIMTPWNYPFYLVVSPLVGAIAAGNCALLKPSELAPNTSAVVAACIHECLDRDAFRVVEGGVGVASKLLEQRFDHIFFTGSPRVGKIIMAAAARHLTPVTLELGGKSPCIVNEDADLDVAARRISWGKFINAGQTCVAPDYILVHEKIADEFVEHLKAVLETFYGEDPQASPDYSRIVNQHQFDRLTGLMGSGNIATGGQVDREDCYIAPTILTDVSPDSSIMGEEIFGPILPVLTVSNMEEAIVFVNKRPKPLALYLFSNEEDVHDKLVNETSSGGVCINDVITHLVVPDLPFGGVGRSGMGAYHGHAGYLAFSHAKSVLTKSGHLEIQLRYPPFTGTKFKWLRRLT